MAEIVKKEGGVLALYQGITPSLLGSALSWGSYFMMYEIAKSKLSSLSNRTTLGALDHLACATFSGVFTQFFCNPIFVIKTRMQLQTFGGNSNYRSIFRASCLSFPSSFSCF